MAESKPPLTPDQRREMRLLYATTSVSIAALARQYGVAHPTARNIVQVQGRIKPGLRKGNPMAVEAGRKGGLANYERNGSEHFSLIGSKGGTESGKKRQVPEIRFEW